LCPPRDARALAEAMARFIDLSGDARAAMGQAARARAEAAFDEAIVIEAYLERLPQGAGQGAGAP
uniref:hypothetical protein n=1 Tax=Alkalilacustris brevis TaxID=2026338 RepID=UPI003B75CFDD